MYIVNVRKSLYGKAFTSKFLRNCAKPEKKNDLKKLLRTRETSVNGFQQIYNLDGQDKQK